MEGTTLVHVGIAATDLERSVRFWRDALGLRVAATMEDCCDLTDGYHNFRLFQHRGPARPPHVTGLLAYLHLGVKVDDLSTALDRCAALGVPIVCDDVDIGRPYDPANPPTRSFKVEDPDGIVVDVTASDDQWPGVAPR
jgi:catechol 2,3-dioxygenase-like lactoylglutathione lyase family enzyme